MKTKKANRTAKPLAPGLLRKMNAYWRAANYLSVGQIYLYDNPLLKEPLKLSHVKPLVVGHWGTTPGQNFIYVHLNRVVKRYALTSPVKERTIGRWENEGGEIPQSAQTNAADLSTHEEPAKT